MHGHILNAMLIGFFQYENQTMYQYISQNTQGSSIGVFVAPWVTSKYPEITVSLSQMELNQYWEVGLYSKLIKHDKT